MAGVAIRGVLPDLQAFNIATVADPDWPVFTACPVEFPVDGESCVHAQFELPGIVAEIAVFRGDALAGFTA